MFAILCYLYNCILFMQISKVRYQSINQSINVQVVAFPPEAMHITLLAGMLAGLSSRAVPFQQIP